MGYLKKAILGKDMANMKFTLMLMMQNLTLLKER